MFKLLLKKWQIIEEMVEVLKVPYEATVKIQSQKYTLSDFYKCWLVMKIKVKALDKDNTLTQLAAHLVYTLEKRQSQLLDNPTMITALYLDPRLRAQIDDDTEKVRLAKHTILDIWKRLQDTTTQPENENIAEAEGDDDDLLDRYYATQGMKSIAITDSNDSCTKPFDISTSDLDILSQIDSYISKFPPGNRLNSKESILTFWQGQKELLPELYEIAKVVFCIPPTQSTVERSFSALSIIYNESRVRLSQPLLESIVMCALNEQVFHKVQENEILKLKEQDDEVFEHANN